MKRAFVTGGAGFIGSHLAKHLFKGFKRMATRTLLFKEK